MKKSFNYFLITSLMVLIFALGSCNDPVFYNVSQELPKLKPRIDGSPTNFVEYNDSMYVASGNNLYWYKDGIWSSKRFNFWILGITATADYLFLSLDESGAMLQRFDGTDNVTAWQSIQTPDLRVQKIYAEGNVLYVSSGSSSFTTHYLLEDSTILQDVTAENIAMLCGSASSGTSVFLLSNEKKGIFHTTGAAPSSLSLVPDSADKVFTGIINPGNSSGIVFVMDYDGKLWSVTASGITEIASFGDDRKSTGALAVWNDGTGKSLLLVGRKEIGYSYNTGYTYGYIEIEIDASGTNVEGTFKEPGTEAPTTVDNYERYVSSLGKNPINYIHQAVSDNRLFASTQSSGVWSYKERDGVFQWNAEE